MFKRRTFFLSACFFVTKCISHPKVNYSLPFSSFSFYSRKIYETANVTFENTSTFSLNFFFTYRVVGTSSLFLLPFSRLGVFFRHVSQTSVSEKCQLANICSFPFIIPCFKFFSEIKPIFHTNTSVLIPVDEFKGLRSMPFDTFL